MLCLCYIADAIAKLVDEATAEIDGASGKLSKGINKAEQEFNRVKRPQSNYTAEAQFNEKETPMLDETGIAEMQNHSVYFDKPKVHLEDVVLDNGRLGPTGATGMTGSASTGSIVDTFTSKCTGERKGDFYELKGKNVDGEMQCSTSKGPSIRECTIVKKKEEASEEK
eukprot:g2702.t1